MKDIKKVGVIGCGQMGSGIVQVCAQSGYETFVTEAEERFLEAGVERIKKILKRGLDKGKITEEKYNNTLSSIKPTMNLSDFSDCDIIIEAIIENPDLKKQTFKKLDELLKTDSILATNTSSISITKLASSTTRADRFIGLHFFNPVPVMKLVEIIQGLQTSEETYNLSKKFCESLGKTTITVKDNPGFVVNYLLIPYLLDAIRAYDAGVATKEDIDTGMKLGCNMPMGPLELADFIGLDTVKYISEVLYEGFKDPKYAVPPLLEKMVTANLLGRKSKKGFYSYG